MKWTNAAITGISGLFVAIGFTFNIWGAAHFQQFITYIVVITFVSSFSGLLIKRTTALKLALIGGVISLMCWTLVLLYAAYI